MAFIHRTKSFANHATTAIFLLFAIVTLWTWTKAGQGPGALAEAFAWTTITLVAFGISAGVERVA